MIFSLGFSIEFLRSAIVINVADSAEMELPL